MNIKLVRLTQTVILSSFLMCVGCKDPELVGINTLDDTSGLNVQVADTFLIEGTYHVERNLQTSGISSFLVGGMNDPVLGKVGSTIWTQFHIGSSNVEFGENARIDSVIAYLSYNGAYGSLDRFNGLQEIEVHELDEAISEDSTYYQNASHAVTSDPLSTVVFSPDMINGINVTSPGDTLLVAGETVIYQGSELNLGPALRIPIDTSFGGRVLRSDASVLVDNEAFTAEFKGMAFMPRLDRLSAGQGALLYIDMLDPQTRVRLYYTRDSVSADGATTYELKEVFDLFCGSSAATHTSFYHEYPESILADTANQEVGEQRLIVQAAGGITSKLRFPTLSGLKTDDGGQTRDVSVVRAELVLPIEGESFSDFAPPIQLDMNFIPPDTTVQANLIDEAFEGDNYGGFYNSSDLEYRFNISRQVQWFLNQEIEDPELLLSIYGQGVTGYRGILNGTDHPLRPIKLEVTFTEVE